MSSVEVYITETVEVEGLADKIKEARKKMKGRVTKLSEIAGIHRSYWYGIESGLIKKISEETLRGIEKALDMDFGVVMHYSLDHSRSQPNPSEPPQ
ncbi:MAG: helix-turn-helix transcriptional regulator [Moorea sp. SIO4G2]|nr:helix-turn-helix transcriptional regulator [Moorena sp. SIO4G2]